MQIDFSSIVAITLLLAVIALAVMGRREQRRGAGGVDRALVKEHGKLKDRIAAVEAQVGGCATKSDFAVLNGKIDALEEHAASSGEINALEGKVNVVAERVEGLRGTIQDMRDDGRETRESVKVIERLLMKGALDK